MRTLNLFLVFIFAIRCVEAQNFALSKTLSISGGAGTNESIQNIRYSPDGKLIAAATRSRHIIVWDVVTGKQVIQFDDHQDLVSEVSFDPTGNLLASASADGSVKLWNVNYGRLIATFHNEPFLRDGKSYSSVSFAVFSPDSRYLFFGGDNGYIMRVDLESTDPRAERFYSSNNEDGSWYATITGGSISPSGRSLTFSVGKKVISIDMHTAHVDAVFYYADSYINDIAKGPNHWTLASWSYDGKVEIWSYPNGVVLNKFQVAEPKNYSACTFSRCGNYLATGASGFNARIWNWKTGKEIEILKGHKSLVRVCRFSPTQDVLATASYDGTVKLWRYIHKSFHGPAEAFVEHKLSFGEVYILRNVNFIQSSFDLRETNYEELDDLVELLHRNQKLAIQINGHTDNIGSPMANKTLSKRRAITIKNYMLDRGVSSERILVKAYGGDSPIYDNSSEEGRVKNRRVEVMILKS